MASTHKCPRAMREDLREEEFLLQREIGKLLGKSLDQDLVIREILHLLSELLGLNRGRVVLHDPRQGDYCIQYAYGLTREEMARGRYRAGEGVTGQVIRTGEIAIVQDIDEEPGYLQRAVDRDHLPRETVSYIAMPLLQEGRIIGALGVHRLRHRARALADDLQILKLVSTLVAQTLRLNKLVREQTVRLEQENQALRHVLERQTPAMGAYGIVGESAALHRVFRHIEQVSTTNATVLLLGESGTGKELFARALHLMSSRRDAPFVKVNCGAIPENLFESELFGYEKGAFTGANANRPGRFEQANGGTLFLDEIGDLPLPMQVKLLRTLQERTVERIGGRKEIAIDVRIVAATNLDLQERIREGRFRLDLYYRLNVIPIHLPALRDRREDIPPLVRYHLNQINQAYQRNVNLSPEALKRLADYPWPGNIRQLRNILERLAVMADGTLIQPAAVEQVLGGEFLTSVLEAPEPSRAALATVRDYQLVQQSDRERIEWALAQTRGNKSRAAQLLHMTLRQLNYRMKLLNM